MDDPTLQQKINSLCEKLSIGGWKPDIRCGSLSEDGMNICWCDQALTPLHPHFDRHDIPAPDLLSPIGHLMLEKALWERGIEIEIHRYGLRVGKVEHSFGAPRIIGDIPLALVLAAYDALHKE